MPVILALTTRARRARSQKRYRQVDLLVAGLGTGGTLMGCADRLRESFPDVQICAAEPLQGEDVMGLRSLDDGYVPPILDVSKLDRKILVSNTDACGQACATCSIAKAYSAAYPPVP